MKYNNVSSPNHLAPAVDSLDPQQDQQMDIFICDIIDASPKDDLGSMEHPVYSLSTSINAKTRRYERNGIFIDIIPSTLGFATIFDKDILIYCASQLREGLNRNREVSKTVKVTAFDLLTATNRQTDGDGYQRLKLALDRLKGTVIKTNIRTGKKKTVDAFSLIDKYRIVEKSPTDSQMISLEITVSDWLFNAIQAKETLTLHREYFQLRQALERRFYELGRKHCGSQSECRVSIQTLYEKSGSFAELKEFRRMAKAIAEKNNLPGYDLTYFPEEDIVLFRNKGEESSTQFILKQIGLFNK